MSKHSAFDGQVTFECGFETLEAVIVRDNIRRALPEASEYEDGSQMQGIWNNFLLIFPNTLDIQFKLAKTADTDLVQFKAFWDRCSKSADYAATWKAFLSSCNLYIVNEWVDAVNGAIPARYLAPADIHPTAPPDDALDPNG